MVKKKFPILIFSILFIALALSTLGAITFQNIFPTTSPYVTSDDTVNLSYGIDASDGLSSITHSWNGTNTTLYDSSLVLFMNFENRSELGENDTFVRDLSMYGNNGTIVAVENVSWCETCGYNSGGFNFTGNKAGYIKVANSNSLNLTQFTIIFDINPANVVDSTRILFNKASDYLRKQYGVYQYGADIHFWVANATGTVYHNNYTRLSYPNILTAGTWTNIIVTFNGTTMTIYKNGIYGVSTTTSIVPVAVTDVLYIGDNTWHESFNGLLDNIMIFNVSFSANQVAEISKTKADYYNSTYVQYNITEDNSVFSQSSFLCSTNSTGDVFCSSTNTIREVNNIQVNFSNTIRTLSNGTMFGLSEGVNEIGNSTTGWDDYVDTNCDSNYIGDLPKDKLWNRNLFLDGKFGWMRASIDLNSSYSNTSDSSGVNFTGTLSVDLIETLLLAEENNFNVMIQIVNVPDFLAINGSTGNKDGCNGGTNQKDCIASNYTKYANIIYDIINKYSNSFTYIDKDKLYFEWFNEPYSWNGNILVGFLNNATNYTRQLDNELRFGTAGGCTFWSSSYQSLCLNVLQNYTEGQFQSFHDYPDSYIGSGLNNNMKDQLDWIIGNCTGEKCYHIIQSEGNMAGNSLKNGTANQQQFAMQLGAGYLDMLNYPNSSIRLDYLYFHWTDEEAENCTNYEFKPDIYSMIVQKGAVISGQPQFKSSYNLTKNVNNLCPAGATVYVTSGDDSEIKQVSCKKGNMYSLIVINTGTEAKNITLNMSMTNGTVVYPYANLVNYEDDTTTYKVSSDGIVQLGVMDSYEILYLYSGVEGGSTLRGVFKLNEGSGNTIYDSLQNLSNGVKSGATWINDGIFKTLTSAIDYTISTSGLLVVSSSYLFNYMNASWIYLATWRDTGSTASLVMVDSLGNSTTFLSLLIVISFAVVILTLFKPSVNTNPLGKPHY